MKKRKLLKILVLILVSFLAACTRQQLPQLVIAEEEMVQDCRYLGTISEISDQGIIFPNTVKIHSGQQKLYDGQRKVLLRADQLDATHIVWLYNYASGSAALVYRCGNDHEHIDTTKN